MSDAPAGNRIGFLLLGLSLAAGLIISALIVSASAERIKLARGRITVKGFAERRITSDTAVWRCKVTARSTYLKAAYEQLEEDMAKVLAYLAKEGIPKEQIDTSSVSTENQYKRDEKGYNTNEIEGYVLEQVIEINSNDVQTISRLSKESTSLIKKGIEFISFNPQYYASEFDKIKISLIGEATKNARLRADQFADNSGMAVGSLESASQGVFQVTAVNSTEITSYGMYDTGPIEKSVKAVVTIEYSIRQK